MRKEQKLEESVGSFMTSFHRLVMLCGYGTLKEELIRDRFVVGLQESSFLEKLQSDPNLKLEAVYTRA